MFKKLWVLFTLSYFLLGLKVSCLAQKKEWRCGSEDNMTTRDGAKVNTAWECAAMCRWRYPNEIFFEWGFIGGSREKECIWVVILERRSFDIWPGKFTSATSWSSNLQICVSLIMYNKDFEKGGENFYSFSEKNVPFKIIALIARKETLVQPPTIMLDSTFTQSKLLVGIRFDCWFWRQTRFFCHALFFFIISSNKISHSCTNSTSNFNNLQQNRGIWNHKRNGCRTICGWELFWIEFEYDCFGLCEEWFL